LCKPDHENYIKMDKLKLVTFPLVETDCIPHDQCDWSRLVVKLGGNVGIVQYAIDEGMHQFRIAWSNGNTGPWFKNIQELEQRALKPLNIKLYQL
jgi:hypothetical protein